MLLLVRRLVIFILFFFSEPHYDAEFDHLLRGKEIVVQADSIKLDGLTSEQV